MICDCRDGREGGAGEALGQARGLELGCGTAPALCYSPPPEPPVPTVSHLIFVRRVERGGDLPAGRAGVVSPFLELFWALVRLRLVRSSRERASSACDGFVCRGYFVQERECGIGLTVFQLCACGVNIDMWFRKCERWLGGRDADTLWSPSVQKRCRTP